MGLEALITLDLPEASDEQREEFYKICDENWIKLPNLSTTWKVSCEDSENPEIEIKLLIEDIQCAKDCSGVPKVIYAIQIGDNNIKTGSL